MTNITAQQPNVRQITKNSRPTPITGNSHLIMLDSTTKPLHNSNNPASAITTQTTTTTTTTAHIYPTTPSASIALINKIRAIESRKKHITLQNITLSSNNRSYTNNSINLSSLHQQQQQQYNMPPPMYTLEPRSIQQLPNNNEVLSLKENFQIKNKQQPQQQQQHFGFSRQAKTSTTASSDFINRLQTQVDKFNVNGTTTINGNIENVIQNFTNNLNGTANNPFIEKMADQKFFDRSYRGVSGPGVVMANGNGLQQQQQQLLNAQNKLINGDGSAFKHVRPMGVFDLSDNEPIEQSEQQPGNELDANASKLRDVKSANVFNKLKLLKKRNLIKKIGLASTTTVTTTETNTLSNDQYSGIGGGTSTVIKRKQAVDEVVLTDINKRHSFGLNTTNPTHGQAITPAATPSSKAKSENYVYELLNRTQKNITNSMRNLFTDRQNPHQRQHMHKSMDMMNNSNSNGLNAEDRLTATRNRTEFNLKNIKLHEITDDDEDIMEGNNTTPLEEPVNVQLPHNSINTNLSAYVDMEANLRSNKKADYLKLNLKSLNNNNNNNGNNNDSDFVNSAVFSELHAHQQKNPNEINDFRVYYPSNAIAMSSKQPIRVIVKQRTTTTEVPDAHDRADFERLFVEDEYFREIHRKCTQWMNNHVIPHMPRILEKARRKHFK